MVLSAPSPTPRRRRFQALKSRAMCCLAKRSVCNILPGFLDASFDEYLVGGVDVSSDRDVQNTPEEMLFGPPRTVFATVEYRFQ